MASTKIQLTILFIVAFVGATAQSNTLQLNKENPHFFNYKGKPLLIISSSEHYGAVVNKSFDYKRYLETLAKDSLNYTRLFLGSYIEKVGDFGIQHNTLAPAEAQLLLPWKRSNQEGFFLGGNKFDLSLWNDEYFSRLKDYVLLAQQKDIIVEITLFSSYYGSGWKYCPFNPSNNINNTDNIPAPIINTVHNGNILKEQERYVKKIVNELNEFDNIYFEIQNEPWADQVDTIFVKNDYDLDKKWTSSLQVVSQLSLTWQQKVASWIREEEKNLKKKHLISQNISNFYYPVADQDENVDIFNFHYALPLAVEENYHLNKPIGFNETGFAGRADNTYRRQAWRFIMAGGTLFNQLDYSFSVGKENGIDTTYKSPGGGSVSLRSQFNFLKRFFYSLPFVNLRPDKTFLKAAPGYYSQVLSNGKDTWVIYLEAMGIRSHDLLLNIPSNGQISWFDVKSGATITSGAFEKGLIKVPAGTKDKVAIVRLK